MVETEIDGDHAGARRTGQSKSPSAAHGLSAVALSRFGGCGARHGQAFSGARQRVRFRVRLRLDRLAASRAHRRGDGASTRCARLSRLVRLSPDALLALVLPTETRTVAV